MGIQPLGFFAGPDARVGEEPIGVLIAVHQVPPAAGFEVLREVSQRTDIKLHAVAGTVIGWALG
ncbi:ANTAR domain-containing protein, partial [Streptomyces sp. SID625]|nr:ANTAR domain-containing protein [Streptomyces sp. SID625]